MKLGSYINAELDRLPSIPEDAGPTHREWIVLRDLLLRAKAQAENIKMKGATL